LSYSSSSLVLDKIPMYEDEDEDEHEHEDEDEKNQLL
jgi:hypothetical protein